MVTSTDYYTTGNSEVATETALTVKRLEQRQKLTKTLNRTVIVLVGLPARGKSFVARKLQHYFNWTGVHCQIFNVGKYRREAYAEMLEEADANNNNNNNNDSSNNTDRTPGACDANFFDANNSRASELREKVATMALLDMLRWLDAVDEQQDNSDDENSGDGGQSSRDLSRHSSNISLPGAPKLNFKTMERVAIFDATNSTQKRREWVLDMCTSPEKRIGKPTGVVFVESICDDQELLEENYRYKVSSSPDFAGIPIENALLDLRNRVKKYEDQYETITDDSMSYIKVFNLSTKLMVNHIYGRMAKEIVPALMAWHIGTRPVYLCRPGQTISGVLTDGEDYVNRQKINLSDFDDMCSVNARNKSLRGDTLGPNGRKFRDDLYDYCYDECHAFMTKRASVHDMAYTGTSISGLAPAPGCSHHSNHNHCTTHNHNNNNNNNPVVTGVGIDYDTIPGSNSLVKDPFPLRVYTSTMPRATETVYWEDFSSINQRSNLNPLDKGDYNGMELDEIKELNPEWYRKLERDPYNTRFPGGESYRDLMSRLTSIVIDVEQQVVPTLIVSHVSILQCLMAYFRNTRVEQCMSIEVPLHTVIKFTPVRGGGWLETQEPLFDIPDHIPIDDEPQLLSSSPDLLPVESMSEISQLSREIGQFSPGGGGTSLDRSVHSDVALPAPIWGDGMTSPRSMLQKVKLKKMMTS